MFPKVQYCCCSRYLITYPYTCLCLILYFVVKACIQPNILQLISGIEETFPVNSEWKNEVRWMSDINGDRPSGSLEAVLDQKLSPNWDFDMNFEWRGGKLELSTAKSAHMKNNRNRVSSTIISLPYIKLFSSIKLNQEQLASDTFILV